MIIILMGTFSEKCFMFTKWECMTSEVKKYIYILHVVQKAEAKLVFFLLYVIILLTK
jgi:hypothetical protein